MSSGLEKSQTPDAKPNPPSRKWVKDAEGIAKAWGLKLYKQRKMMVKQLDAVRAAMLAEGFPAKVKGKGYDRAAVMAFGMARVEVSKNGRDCVVQSLKPKAQSQEVSNVSGLKPKVSSTESPTLDVSLETKDLPPAERPAGDAELFADVSPTELRRERFDFLQKLYLYPERHERKITGIEIKELKAERPELFAKETESSFGGADSENITGTLRGVAGWIKVNYPGCNPTHTDIKNWKAGAHLPYGCKENFPAWDESGNRHKTSEVRSWVERYLVKRAAGQSALPMDMDYRQAQEKLDYERSVKENELWEQSISNKFMETTIVAGFIEGFGTWLGFQQDRLIEDKSGVRRMVADAVRAVFNANAEQLAILDARLAPELVAANDAMKTAAGHQGAELLRQLTADRKESVQKALAKNT